MLYREQLESMGCSTPGCDHSAHDGPLFLHARCHTGAKTRASYEGGVLTITCAVCKAVVAQIAVADEAELPYHPQAGATRNFPKGTVRPDDEGELAMAITVDREHDRIHLDLGSKPISWISMTSGEARGFAELLREKARQLDGLDL